FCDTHNLGEHAGLFRRTVLVARDAGDPEDVSSLTEDELAALILEREHKWHGPFTMWYPIILCAAGAATQGWDQTGSNGANL
ncbi:polyol transporter, partial [Mycena polygramma]